jgi:AcrR family transcriptional regulator
MTTTTKQDILNAALKCARRRGLYDMTRTQIARAAGTATGTVSFHYTDMLGLRRAIVRHCVERLKFMDVLGQALARKDSLAVRAPADVKREALKALA